MTEQKNARVIGKIYIPVPRRLRIRLVHVISALMYVELFVSCYSMLNVHQSQKGKRMRNVLTLPPHQGPARMLKVVRPEVSLYHWPKVDIEYARASVVTCAL